MADPVQYNSYEAHDCICGTKQQLQALGIGVGVAFPGEPGAPRREIETTDPRGFSVVVKKFRGDKEGKFHAYVMFPGFPPEPYGNKPAPCSHPGVMYCALWNTDDYEGSAEALVAAGLVPPGHFPGWPGMRKVNVSILPDGSLPQGAPTANCRKAREPGARQVACVSKAKAIYRVSVFLSREEIKRRDNEVERWRCQVRAMPRPMPLTQYMQQERERARDAIEDAMCMSVGEFLSIKANRGHEPMIRAEVESWLRSTTPRRTASHLRLVHSAPTNGRPHA